MKLPILSMSELPMGIAATATFIVTVIYFFKFYFVETTICCVVCFLIGLGFYLWFTHADIEERPFELD